MSMSIRGIGGSEKAFNLVQTAAKDMTSVGFSEKLQSSFSRNPGTLDSLFRAAGEMFQIHPALLKAVARAESGLNPKAVSKAGALGIMQLMPATAKALGVSDPFDPAQSIFGAARYLRSLLDRFGGDIKLALAAYNAGPGTVQRWGGIPPYRETQEYIKRVLGYCAENGGEQQSEQSLKGTGGEEAAITAGQEARSNPELMRIWANAFMIKSVLEIASEDDEQEGFRPGIFDI